METTDYAQEYDHTLAHWRGLTEDQKQDAYDRVENVECFDSSPRSWKTIMNQVEKVA